MEWFSKYAPGFFCIGRNHHPFYNERHTICCGLTYISWRGHILEGKDHPQQLGKKYAEFREKVSLMLRVSKLIFGTGAAVVLDSGFCVAKGIA